MSETNNEPTIVAEPEVPAPAAAADNATEDYEHRSKEDLISTIRALEADRKDFLTHVRMKISTRESEFETAKAENEILKSRLNDVESQLKLDCRPQSAKNQSNGVDTEEILLQARSLLFEKTKICKQQEQQLLALKNQVDATKDVLTVTKEMLCLRNIENDHTQARMDTLQLRLKAERARQELTEKKLANSQKSFGDLRNEYELQSKIFKQLRSTYEEKIAALSKQLDEAKQQQIAN